MTSIVRGTLTLHPCISGHILFRLSPATALLTFSRKVHGSNLDWDTDYPKVFRGLHQSLSRQIPLNGSRQAYLLSSASKMHYSLYQLRELLSIDKNCGGSSILAVNLACLQTPLQMVHFAVSYICHSKALFPSETS